MYHRSVNGDRSCTSSGVGSSNQPPAGWPGAGGSRGEAGQRDVDAEETGVVARAVFQVMTER